MLKQLGRLERTRSIVILGFALVMAFSLVVFYAPQRTAVNADPLKNTEALAKVGSDTVTVADLAQLREGYRQMLGGQMSLASLGGNRRFLDGLIRDRVIAQEAARLGLGASDAEVAEKIRKQFTDASGQFVGIDKYKESVTARYGDVEKFERAIRDSIAQEKLRAFVTASINVSDEEVEESYKRENTTYDLHYAVVETAKLAEKIQPTDEELRAYFEQHKTDYRILEPQKKIRYLFIEQEKAGAKLQISDKELRDEYERLSPEAKQAGVRVQQILLRVARADLDPRVEQKAKELIAKLRGTTGTATEEAFAEAARGNSEDPATARNGGFLARPVKKNPNRPDALYDRVLDMQPSEVSDIPVKYDGHHYILRRGESVPRPFEEMKNELLISLRNRRGYAEAAKLADRAQARLKELKDPQKVAQEIAVEANMRPAEMVKETPYIKPGDDVPDIGTNQQFEAAIAGLENPNDVGERMGVRNGFAIPMLVDKKEPRIPEFEEVRTKVAQAVKEQRAKEQLAQKAREIAANAKTPAQVKSLAEAASLEVGSEEEYKLGATLGKAGTSPSLDEAIYALQSEQVTTTPIKVGENWVIVGVSKRTEADLAEFASQRDTLTNSLLSERQNQVFEDYISTVQDRMKRDGKIKIYDDVLARMEEAEPVFAPPRPNFPLPTQ
ncbi:MAG TPA: peptidyl-prolyl cis-trans isomerase [Pyrinomonadaceae bacterium]|nr:peptidyl-prolyl cis-trans isomerase [Pyrinomonadaceae bacterium]